MSHLRGQVHGAQPGLVPPTQCFRAGSLSQMPEPPVPSAPCRVTRCPEAGAICTLAGATGEQKPHSRCSRFGCSAVQPLSHLSLSPTVRWPLWPLRPLFSIFGLVLRQLQTLMYCLLHLKKYICATGFPSLSLREECEISELSLSWLSEVCMQ